MYCMESEAPEATDSTEEVEGVYGVCVCVCVSGRVQMYM